MMKISQKISLAGLALCALALLTSGLTPCRADLIKQGSAYNRTVLMTSSADHVTGATGLTLAITLSKNGTAFASVSPTVTELSGGRYKIALGTGNTDTLGPLDLQITAAGADPSDTHDQVVAFDPSDASLLGLTGVATAAAQAANTTALGTISAQTSAANQQANAQAGLSAQGYTTARAPKLDSLDVAVSTRNAVAPDNATVSAINAKLGTPAGTSLSADIAAVQTTSAANGTAIAALPTVTTFLNGLKADAQWQRVLSATAGRYTYNPATHQLQLMTDAGVAVGSPLTLTVTSGGTVTARQ